MAHVMIVDDEAEIRAVLARWLTNAGYRTSEAPDAESAVGALASANVDAVLCDVRMPGRDGLWLVDEIRRRFPTLGLVFATGETRLPPSSTLKDGVVAYVLKPFERDKVLAAVALAIAWHEAALTKPSADNDALKKWLDEEEP